MASATVFVDDAVRGTLPGVCVKDGIPTGDHLTVQQVVEGGAGLGIAWLLVLAGPPGWIALLAIGSFRGGRGDVLVAQVPMSEAAYGRLLGARRQRLRTVLAVIGGLVGSLVLSASIDANLLPLFLVSLVGGVVAIGVASHRVDQASVVIGIDASRRWVTVADVHPAFSAACAAAERQRDRPRR
jgi:hypothetical protein